MCVFNSPKPPPVPEYKPPPEPKKIKLKKPNRSDEDGMVARKSGTQRLQIPLSPSSERGGLGT